MDRDEFLLLTIDKPKTYYETAIKELWYEAMKKELESIRKNKTLELIDLPPDHKIIGGGIEENNIEVKQATYVKKVLKQFAMEDCNSNKYLTHIRPNISYAVAIVSQYMEQPSTLNQHRTVVLSSCVAEFMAATTTSCQGLWLRNLLSEVLGCEPRLVTLYVDNKFAVALMNNSMFHGHGKHGNTQFHFIPECVENQQIVVEFVSTKEQRAYILTKALERVKSVEMRELLSVKS
ncbi:uncharacterized protein LOC124934828 [Impatiens glandulifera]|uniref:uncharacterized protein LOC124934828 n=1 Tax=Impatiens glandulifera TaxID=253017 RepID=UPI001FB05849|nr:uncharacterized protein LOC124934828 [Impatiens glandulifera]